MAFFFGAGAAVITLLMVLRLVPKAFGLAFWLAKTGLTAATASIVLYLVLRGSP